MDISGISRYLTLLPLDPDERLTTRFPERVAAVAQACADTFWTLAFYVAIREASRQLGYRLGYSFAKGKSFTCEAPIVAQTEIPSLGTGYANSY